MQLKTKQRGRPSTVDDGTRERIISSTLDALLEFGYQKTTLDRIIQKAGVAKKTLYRFAGSRDELIQMALGSWCDSFRVCFEHNPLTQDEFLSLFDDGLNAIAKEVLSPKAVGIFRLLQTDFPGRTELVKSYQQQGIQRGRKVLEDWLYQQASKGIIRKQDYSILSNLILSMAIAEPLRELALRQEPSIPLQNRITDTIKIVFPSMAVDSINE